MSNKGLENHSRFRTKYWQQKQRQHEQGNSFFCNSIKGERITHHLFFNTQIQQKQAKKLSPTFERKSVSTQRKRKQLIGNDLKKDARLALKLELMNLSIENFEISRPKSTQTSRIRPFNLLGYESPQRTRPLTGIRLSMQPMGKFQPLQENISLLQKSRYPIFLPARTSRLHRTVQL